MRSSVFGFRFLLCDEQSRTDMKIFWEMVNEDVGR